MIKCVILPWNALIDWFVCPQVNRSRDIVRQAMRWFPEDEDGLKDMFVRYMSALPKSMVVSPSSQKVI